MAFEKSHNEVHGMSSVDATNYVRRMVQRESRGPGDIDSAMQRLEARYGIGFWQLSHIRSGKAKTVDVSLFARIRGAYLDYCQRLVSNLQHEIAVQEALCADDTLEDLEIEAKALAARIAAKKARMK